MENITPIPETSISFQSDPPKKNYSQVILISLALILFLAGAYYLGKQSTNVPVSTSVEVLPIATLVPTVSQVSTINWKTYTNSKLSFTLKYPITWKFTDNQDSVGMDSPESIESRKQYPSAIPFDIVISTIPEEKLPNNSTKVNLDQWIKSSSAKEYGLQNTATKITLDGATGYKGEFCGEFCATEIFVQKNGVIYDIHLNSENIPEIYNQILSTFKFNESKEEFKVVKTNPIFDLSKTENIYQGEIDSISVTFNRDVDQSTLVEKNIGVLWGIQDYIPNKIKYNSSTKTATIFFNKPIKAVVPTERLTFVVDGVEDTSGNLVKKILFNIDITLD